MSHEWSKAVNDNEDLNAICAGYEEQIKTLADNLTIKESVLGLLSKELGVKREQLLEAQSIIEFYATHNECERCNTAFSEATGNAWDSGNAAKAYLSKLKFSSSRQKSR